MAQKAQSIHPLQEKFALVDDVGSTRRETRQFVPLTSAVYLLFCLTTNKGTRVFPGCFLSSQMSENCCDSIMNSRFEVRSQCQSQVCLDVLIH